MTTFYRRRGKRILDLAVAIPALIVLSPILALVGLLVLATTGRPVLFRQERPGQGGRPFVIYKFRTMTDKRDAEGRALADEMRLTALGRLLRKTSLDELPELWNVLIGDMSLVGPRPLLMRYMELYTPEQNRRHEVRPGITGLPAVCGRNLLPWNRRFELDLEYVESLSLGLDVMILAKTAVKALTGRGASAPGHATVPEFTGSEDEE